MGSRTNVRDSDKQEQIHHGIHINSVPNMHSLTIWWSKKRFPYLIYSMFIQLIQLFVTCVGYIWNLLDIKISNFDRSLQIGHVYSSLLIRDTWPQLIMRLSHERDFRMDTSVQQWCGPTSVKDSHLFCYALTGQGAFFCEYYHHRADFFLPTQHDIFIAFIVF